MQEEWVLALEGLSFPKEQASEPLESYSAVQLVCPAGAPGASQFFS